MRKLLIRNGFLALISFGFAASASAQHSYVFGPVELISKQTNELTVLGQVLSVKTCSAATIGSKKFAASSAVGFVRPQSVIYAEFDATQDGAVITSLSFGSETYVAGSSIVQVGARVTRLDTLNGTMDLGSLKIDTSSLRPEEMASLAIGDFVQVSGIQPLQKGLLVNAKLLGVGGSGLTSRKSTSQGSSEVCSMGVGGSGALGVGGSGVLGVGGSGALGVGGSGVLGVGGSGALDVGGSGVLGIGGSGALGIGGSGVLGVGGSGSLGVGGSGALGVGGSGALGVGGSGTLGVGGSGF